MNPSAPASGGALALRGQVLRTLRLAGPVMASRAGLLVMAAVDTVMAGRAGTAELAHYGIAVMPQLTLLLIGIGGLMGTVVLTAQTDGAGHPERCGPVWRLALLNAGGLGTLFALFLLQGEALLLLLGQDPAIAAGGGRVLAMFALGMPAILMYSATTLFLEGLGRSVPGMVVMAAANLVNLGLNALLMFGPLAMGAAGAALATSLTRWFMLLALAGYVLLMPGRARYRIALLGPLAGHGRIEARLLRLGWPMALSFGLESLAFFAAATIAGWQGAAPLAAWQIVINTMALVYMLAIGLATATAVRVGNAVGRRDRAAMARAGWLGLGLGIAIMLALMPLLWGASGQIVRLYTTDPAVIALAAPGLALGAWILVVDASQGILTGALRGAADIWAALAIQLFSFWVVCVPACYLLGQALGYGVPGLLWGLLIGLVIAALLLVARFKVLASRVVRPF
jgi:multidrug resistance protein, MATE family